MKKILITALLFVILLNLHSQNNGCLNNLDSLSLINKLENENLIFTISSLSKEEIIKTPVYQPKVIFDNVNCIWTVSSVNYKTTNSGNCKKTNGCTIITTLTVIVEAETGKIISKRKDMQKIPNYE